MRHGSLASRQTQSWFSICPGQLCLLKHTLSIVFPGIGTTCALTVDSASRDTMRLWTLAGNRYKAAKVDRQIAEGVYTPWDDLPSEPNQVSRVWEDWQDQACMQMCLQTSSKVQVIL